MKHPIDVRLAYARGKIHQRIDPTSEAAGQLIEDALSGAFDIGAREMQCGRLRSPLVFSGENALITAWLDGVEHGVSLRHPRLALAA